VSLAFADISLLALGSLAQEPEREQLFLTPLELLPPALGDRVGTYGYHGGSASMPDEKTIHVRSEANFYSGPVRDVHFRGRDRTHLPHPCFHVACLLEGGMSGCPAFDKHGRVCGIACSGMKATDESEETAYFSLLWPAMGLPLGMEYAGWSPGTTLLDLARRGVIDVHGYEHVVAEPSDGLPVRWVGPEPQ
jgi:hypothetical protein